MATTFLLLFFAGGGSDYISGPYSVKIPAGKTTLSFRISITNDNRRENNETFYLVIDSSSLPNGVVVGSPSQAKVTIVDITSSSKIQFCYVCIDNYATVKSMM